MAALTVLSVNGRDGWDTARNQESHTGILESIPYVAGAAGRSGMNALPANSGEFAGMIQAEISRSEHREGGITIRAIKQRGSRWIAPETEILPCSKILFTAVGGEGEAGRAGGNGEAGTAGETGTAATRDMEAGDGGAGGAGGPAGLGSNGAPGGNGGFIQLVVSEEELELLYGVDCDVSGGQGGKPGRHGVPGEGGKGGSGGISHAWEDVVDHKYRCTPNCVGASTDVAVLASRGGASMEVFMKSLQDQASNRSSFNKTIAKAISITHRAQPGSTQGLGVCVCRGGSGTCPGCLRTPVYRSFARSAGRDGLDGTPAQQPQGQLVKGASGAPGRISILVRRKQGEILEGGSGFNFQLVSFDVDDGNADGIYEPGDVIFIRRIQTKNIGGVISPIRPIDCRLARSDVIEICDGTDGMAYLPCSIPAGSIQVSPGGIRATLSRPILSDTSRFPYHRDESIGIVATMPWTMLPVEGLDFEKTIRIEFPVEMRDIKSPSPITIGRQSTITMKIFNKSTRSFGNITGFQRVAKVIMEVDGEQAELLDEQGSWSSISARTAPLIEARNAADVTQAIRARPRAITHTDISIKVQLYITTPQQTQFAQCPDIAEMQLVESYRINVQAAPGYVASEDDEVLIVTNAYTRTKDIDAILHFFESELACKTNVWNVSKYGGLIRQDPSCSDEVESILADYKGKTVILLGNGFHLSDKSLAVVSLCDPLSILAASRCNTSCLFFGTANSEKYQEILDSLFRPIEGEVLRTVEDLPSTSRHHTFKNLVQCLLESTSQTGQSHSVTIRESRFRSREKTMTAAANELAEMLLTDVPLYHFSICIVPKQDFDDGDTAGCLFVQQGFRRISQVQASQSDLLRSAESIPTVEIGSQSGFRRQSTRFRREESHLTWYDKLSLISALPVTRRLELLDGRRERATPEILELAELSVERQIDLEMQDLIELTKNVKPKGVSQENLLKACLPVTRCMMDYVTAKETLSTETRRIVGHSFASCRPQTTGVAMAQAVNPLMQTRRLVERMLTQKVGKKKDLELDQQSVPDKRRVSLSLESRISKVTGQAGHFQRLSNYGPQQSLRKNDILTIEAWNKAGQRARNIEADVLDIFTTFQDEQARFEGSMQPVPRDDSRMKESGS